MEVALKRERGGNNKYVKNSTDKYETFDLALDNLLKACKRKALPKARLWKQLYHKKIHDINQEEFKFSHRL